MTQHPARSLALALGLTLAFATAASAQTTYIPLISKGFQHQFWQAVKSGAEQAGKDYNVKVTFEGPETEAMVDKQIDMLSAALAKNPQAIGFSPPDSQPPSSRAWPSTRASPPTSPSPRPPPTTAPPRPWPPTRWRS